MDDAMVTARMSREKKDAGNRVLAKLGTNASQVVNRVYDYVIEHGELPSALREERSRATEAQMRQAVAWADELLGCGDAELARMTDDEIEQERLIERGVATRRDFL